MILRCCVHTKEVVGRVRILDFFKKNCYHFYIYLHVCTLFGQHLSPPLGSKQNLSTLLFSDFVEEKT
jgi:hypothetical protein